MIIGNENICIFIEEKYNGNKTGGKFKAVWGNLFGWNKMEKKSSGEKE